MGCDVLINVILKVGAGGKEGLANVLTFGYGLWLGDSLKDYGMPRGAL